MDTLQNIHILQHKYRITTMEVWASILVAGITGGVGTVVTALFYRGLNEAKVKSIVAETYDKLVEALAAEVTSLRTEVERLRKRVDILSEKELQYLTQITELTKERNKLTLAILEKDNRIHDLEKKISIYQNKT